MSSCCRITEPFELRVSRAIEYHLMLQNHRAFELRVSRAIECQLMLQNHRDFELRVSRAIKCHAAESQSL